VFVGRTGYLEKEGVEHFLKVMRRREGAKLRAGTSKKGKELRGKERPGRGEGDNCFHLLLEKNGRREAVRGERREGGRGIRRKSGKNRERKEKLGKCFILSSIGKKGRLVATEPHQEAVRAQG